MRHSVRRQKLFCVCMATAVVNVRGEKACGGKTSYLHNVRSDVNGGEYLKDLGPAAATASSSSTSREQLLSLGKYMTTVHYIESGDSIFLVSSSV